MTSKLVLYNLALGHLNERKLASLSETREPRRVLDDVWDSAVAHCIERGMWKFAIRSVEQDASTGVTPTFGYTLAFQIPTDWVRTVSISTSETMNPPLFDVREEAGYWFANFEPLFIQYISNNTTYGMNLGVWSQLFSDYVALRLATQGCRRITGSDKLLSGENGLDKKEKKALTEAKATDAMNDPPGFPPAGSWTRSRRGSRAGVPFPGDSGSGLP